MPTKSYVTAAKPATGGAVYRAPSGTTLPTSASADLDAAFVEAGYISQDGLTNSNTMTTEQIRAWGGDVVLTTQTEKTDTFQCTFIESMNLEVLEMVYTDDNVSGSLSAGIVIKANANEQEEHSYVVDMVLRNGVLKRVVIPAGVITEVAEVQYSDSNAVGYQVTITAFPDDTTDACTHYEYILSA